MIDRKELTESLQKQYEDEFFKEHGFVMNRHQKKLLAKQVDKIVDRTIKSADKSF